MVHLENVAKSYKGNRVLRDVSLSLAKGTITGLTGQNGSGKSVLMKIVTGLVKPDLGTVTVIDKRIGKDVDFAPDTGILIEEPGFMPFLSARRNLRLLAAYKNKITNAQIDDSIRRVGLDPAARKGVGKYSTGMRQRLGIAQAIMEDPALLLLDEPMNGLDKSGMREMRALFLALNERGATVLLSSHNMQDIDELCEAVYELESGVLTKLR